MSALAGCGGPVQAPRPRAPADVTVSGRPSGPPIPPGFLGLSFEYQGTRHYEGVDPRAVDPVLVRLIDNLTPGQAPLLRIGGDSTDATWWPVAGRRRPPWVKFTLTPDWVRTTGALARELGARLILGVNLAAEDRAIAGAEARALLEGIGRRYVEALELGNEPEVYGQLPWYVVGGRRVYARLVGGRRVYARPPTYGVASYTRDVEAIRPALPPVALAGPATGAERQLAHLPALLSAVPQLKIVTFHRYPANRCARSADSPAPATISGLLSARASRGLMDGARRWVAFAHRRGLRFRVDELGTVACVGKLGVSDTFASALWAVDALFALARDGVDGVNVHTFPRAGYSLFLISHPGGRWRAFVHPEYYGLLMFARAAPPGSRLVSVRLARAGDVRAWATRARDGTLRVVLINDGTTAARTVLVRVPGPPRPAAAAHPATLERLTAPSASSTGGVTLAGQSFGAATLTGELSGRLRASQLKPAAGAYRVLLPAASAALITIGPGPQ